MNALASGFANLTWRGPANPDLKWETTSQYNVGVDMGFFQNRINLWTIGSVDYTENI